MKECTSLVVVLNSLYSADLVAFLIPLSLNKANGNGANSYFTYSFKSSSVLLLMDIRRNSKNGSTGIVVDLNR